MPNWNTHRHQLMTQTSCKIGSRVRLDLGRPKSFRKNWEVFFVTVTSGRQGVTFPIFRLFQSKMLILLSIRRQRLMKHPPGLERCSFEDGFVESFWKYSTHICDVFSGFLSMDLFPVMKSYQVCELSECKATSSKRSWWSSNNFSRGNGAMCIKFRN